MLLSPTDCLLAIAPERIVPRRNAVRKMLAFAPAEAVGRGAFGNLDPVRHVARLIEVERIEPERSSTRKKRADVAGWHLGCGTELHTATAHFPLFDDAAPFDPVACL